MRILNSNSEIPVNQFSGFKYFPVFILQVTKSKLSESLDKVRRLLSVAPPRASGRGTYFPFSWKVGKEPSLSRTCGTAFKAGAEALSVQPAPAEANNSRTEIQCQGLRSVPNSKLV